ncbi:LysE family translocator [Vibrio maerlii]|uniref:LysE family translocator n=1 Tax=Vibrio maerlii TaxID=2231648 RepID=UPI000E3CBD86|nr:LysE family translocator [Vibrio maerlii]
MSIDIWLYYVVAVLILTASPGPSSLLCMTKGVTSGVRLAMFTALGSLTAITMILTLSFTGLGVLIASSELAFQVIKWVGAAYLVYLGFIALRSKQQDYELNSEGNSPQSKWSWTHARSNYISGFIVGASNPKAILFFTALFPQFIDPSHSLLSQYLIFSATFIVFEFSWLMLYTYLGARSSRWLFKPGRAKWFNRVTGGVFIGAGGLLSTATR